MDTVRLSPSILKVRTTAPPWQRGSQESRARDGPVRARGSAPLPVSPHQAHPPANPARPLQSPSPQTSRQPHCYLWSPRHPLLLRWCKSLLPGLPTSVLPLPSAALSVASGVFQKASRLLALLGAKSPRPLLAQSQSQVNRLAVYLSHLLF